MSVTQYLDRRFYPTFRDRWDVDLFRRHIEAYLGEATAVLDYGAGRGAHPQMDLRGPKRFVAGVDVDEAVFTNPYLNEASLLDATGRIPYASDRFDVAIAHNVLEHLPDPTASFREIHRVLRPGGVFLSKTPNRRHYVATLARLTPHSFHVWVNRKRGRKEFDTFPTLYRANTPGTMAALAKNTGFSVETLELVEGRPEYLRHSAPLYLVGLVYERIVNRTSSLTAFRVGMLTTLRKSSA